MDETTPQASAKETLTKEQRSKIMSEAAKRRWEKARKAKAKAVKIAPKSPPKALPVKKRPTAPREFSSALKVAEKRLAKAITERAEAAAKYAAVSAEIPSLMQIINSLKSPLGTVPLDPSRQYQYGYAPAPPTLEQIVGDQPLAYQNPPRTDIPAAPPPFPTIPVPPALHPANATGRAGGGAVGMELEETEDEDQFLKESPVSGGVWH
jgi:hypothetical protein